MGDNIGNLFKKDTPWNAKHSHLRKGNPTNWQFNGTKLVRQTFEISLSDINLFILNGTFNAFTNSPQDLNGSAISQNGNITQFASNAIQPVEFRVTSFNAPLANHPNNQNANGTYNFQFNSGQAGGQGSRSATLMGGQSTNFNSPFTTDASGRFTGTRSPISFNIQPNNGCDCYDGRIRIQVRKRVAVP